jgi:membrane protease YdiL (CAAX protease family)
VIWHLPFFLLPGGGQVVGNTPLLWFSLLTIAWSVLFAWTYVNTESIWIPVLFHAAVNTTLGSLGILGQAGGEMRVLIIYTALTWLFVFLIVIISGKNLVHFRHIRGHPEYNKDASGNR